MPTALTNAHQLQDAAKKKFSKCEHIDVDWGVGNDEEDIYQTPVIDSQPAAITSQPLTTGGSIKKSETTGNFAGRKSLLAWEHHLGDRPGNIIWVIGLGTSSG